MSQLLLPPASKVVVALDGSAAAASAVPHARALADQFGAKLEALYVIPARSALADRRARARLRLGPDAGVNLRLEEGDPAEAILKDIQEAEVVALVMSTHGKAIQAGQRLGRVAEAVIRGTTRPILLVRPETRVDASAQPSPLRRMLVPLDGTPSTARALRPVGELADRLHASIDLLYVAGADQARSAERGSLQAPQYVDQPQHEWPAWAREVFERLYASVDSWPASVQVQIYLTQGEIGKEIARFAAEHAADAVVLVRRSQLQPGRAQALRQVLFQTPCPVILIGGPPT